MSDDLEHQLREDRIVRDAAYALVEADLANLRTTLSGKSISSRIVDRIGEGASDAVDDAIALAENNKGIVAALIAAIVLWFARYPIIALFVGDAERDEDDDR